MSKTQDPIIECLQETNFKYKHTNKLAIKMEKMIFHANTKVYWSSYINLK